MKSVQRILCVLVCVCMALLCACSSSAPVESTTLAAESETDVTAAQSDSYLVQFKGEQYTPYLYDDDVLMSSFDTCKTLSDKKQKAKVISGANADDTDQSVNVQTYKDDPQRNFLYESGTAYGERLLRKTTYAIPDYRDPSTKVSRIVWGTSWSDAEDYASDDLIVWDDPQVVATFMEFVCQTAADPASAQTKPVDRKSEAGKICFVEFADIDGRLCIGYMAPSTDGTKCMYFSDFPQENAEDEAYGVVPMPQSLQSIWNE